MTHGSVRRRGPGRPARMDLAQILDAAEAVGLDGLTTTAVAQRLGVTEGAVRRHVSSADRLYSRTCARIFERLQLPGDRADTWQEYLRLLGRSFLEMLEQHPGLADYVVRGPYEEATLLRFQRIIDDLMDRDPAMTASTAHLVGSRVITLTAATHFSAPSRYRTDRRPPPGLAKELFEWSLEAFLAGSTILLDRGEVPQFDPTPAASWARAYD